jgi:SAM-dependent methyltransferase
MPDLETRLQSHIVPKGLSYFEYGRRLCDEVVLPWLSARLDLKGLDVGDFGAHEGGMLDGLRESGLFASGVGIELSADVVASSPFVADDRFRLEVGDVTARAPDAPTFDLVVLHDVLEHIPDYEGAVASVASALRPGGHLFVTFPPYYSYFGGHQHHARGFVRHVPFLHLLPGRLFFRLVRPEASEYMTADADFEDMVSVRATRLTLGRAERAFARAGLEVVDRDLFLMRPEYTVRYGVKTRRAGFLGRLPLVREALVGGGFYLVRKRA